MGTKTIGIKDEVYDRLKARKREGESFTDLLDRILDETTTDWREGFGTLSEEEGDRLEQIAETSRKQTSTGLATRQREAIVAMSDEKEDNETS